MKKIRIEHILYTLAFLLALGVRLLNLGEAPFSDFEAGWALQSLALARGDTVSLGAQPGYLLPTTLFFSLFEDTNFVARFWPALAGSLLVLVPYAFRPRLGQKAALIAAFGLVFDPGMVALSRLAGGPMPAIAFTVLALALLFARQFAWGGIVAGLALLSGPTMILGLLGIGVAYGLARLTGALSDGPELPEMESTENPERAAPPNWRRFLLFGAGTILLVGTLFFRHPQGLGAWAATVSAFLRDGFQTSGIPSGRLLVAVIFYAILALVFGLTAIIRGWLGGSKIAQALSFWFLLALCLPILLPGRQVGDVAWALVPLWGLAGLELARSARRESLWFVSLGQAALLTTLMIVIWLTLSGLDTAIPEQLPNYWLVMGAALVICFLVTLLVWLGWSWATARVGLVWGLVTTLGIYTLASAFWVSQVRPNTPLELWVPAPTTRHADLFADTVENLALSQSGHDNHLEVTSLVDTPSLRWVLRDLEGVRYVSALGLEETPLVVITRADGATELRQDIYRGQDFGWWESPGWGGALPWEPMQWIINRQASLVVEDLVLWGRLDLFPEDTVSADQQSADSEPDLEGVSPQDEASPFDGEGVEVDE